MKKRIALSFIFLLTGIIIYILFKSHLIVKSNVIFSFMRNYGPDICWTISFYFASIVFVKNVFKKSILVNSLYILLFAMIYEVFQLFGFINGTFDYLDLITYLISILLSCLIELFFRRIENEKNF